MGLFNKKSTDASRKVGTYQLRHILGLEIPEIDCTVNMYGDKIQVSAIGSEYTLAIEQILAVDFDMNVDIERYSKASLTKGVAGAVLFGVAGAVIGSAPKTKIERHVTCSSVVSYMASDNQQKFLLLSDAIPNSLQAAKFTDALRKLIIPRTKDKKTL